MVYIYIRPIAQVSLFISVNLSDCLQEAMHAVHAMPQLLHAYIHFVCRRTMCNDMYMHADKCKLRNLQPCKGRPSRHAEK